MVMSVADTYLPMTLSIPDMTDAKFEELCQEYDAYCLEYTAEGELLIMPPTDPETGAQNAIIIFQLTKWSIATGHGIATDSSAGFLLPNGARRSPDASWTSRNRFRRRPGCPEFVIELLSPTDRVKKADQKMREWLSNGVELGWLIDPRTRTVTIYRPDREPEVRKGIMTIVGEGPVEGFTLDLASIWEI